MTTAWTFSTINAALSLIYSLVCFIHYDQPFWGATALFFGALASIYPPYLERQRIDVAHGAQVAEYLQTTMPRAANSLLRRHLEAIARQLAEVKTGRLTLMPEQLAAYLDARLIDRQSDRRPAQYWVTHIVESDASVNVWLQSRGTHTFIAGYVDRQRAILNAGGEVVRIFLFAESYVRSHLESCALMIAHHEALFAGTRKPVVALAGLLPTQPIPRYEVSILDGAELFTYDWAGGMESWRSTYRHGTYSVVPTDVESEISNWCSYRDNATEPAEFFKKLGLSPERRLL